MLSIRKVSAATVGTSAVALVVGLFGAGGAAACTTGHSGTGHPGTTVRLDAVIRGHHHHRTQHPVVELTSSQRDFHGHGYAGTISALGTDSFTLTHGNSSVVVDVSPTTQFIVPETSGPTFSNLAVGDDVVVKAMPSGTSGTVDAVKVAVVPLQLSGTVAAVGASSFTLSQGSTSVIVDVSSSTEFHAFGVSSATFANVAVADAAHVDALATGIAGTVNALKVAVLPPPHVNVFGTVSALATDSFTVTHDSTSVTVDVSSTTQFIVPDTSGATFANLAVGDKVAVEATSSGTAGTVDALKVRIAPVEVAGTLSVLGTNSFTLTHGSFSVVVDVSSTTQYFASGIAAPTFANLAVGDHVIVKALPSGTVGSVNALKVGIHS